MSHATRPRCTAALERQLRQQGYQCIAGVDEVGRGCLFGPVYAAAVVLNPDRPVRGLRDSKQIPPERRTALAEQIHRQAVAVAIGTATVDEIDCLNILQATRLAMARAVSQLSPAADHLLLDAVTLDVDVPQQAHIRGDARIACIAAASIVAKVARDVYVAGLEDVYPGYGLARHKGYGTAEHLRALAVQGPTPEHRRSFAPVAALLQQARLPLP